MSHSGPPAFARTLILVSGAPGAGKTTLAVPLARRLELPLLTKDMIKEQLYDSLGSLDSDPLTSSRRLGAAAMELLWRLASFCPAVVLEANFRPNSSYERARITKLCPRPIEVHCVCPADEAARRYAERATQHAHHPVHALRELSAELLAEFPGPVGMGEVIKVDTTATVDIEHVVGRVQHALRGGGD